MTFSNNATTHKKETILLIKKNLNHVTLRECSLNKRAVDISIVSHINSINYLKRPYLCASRHFKGSITVEAALAFPLFFFVIISLIFIINMMYLQTTIQIALEEVGRHVTKSAYISEKFYSLNTDTQADITDESSSVIENIGASLLSVKYIKSLFLTDEMTSFLDNSSIKNGADGISFSSSRIDTDENLMDIILTYEVKIPFLPDSINSFNLSNRCYIRLYTGCELNKEQEETDFYVYYTPTGRVFHINRYCRYLLDYTNISTYGEALFYGYIQCNFCVPEDAVSLKLENPAVYITEKGRAFHLTLHCQSFTGNIFRVHYSSLDEDDKICAECMKGK